MTEKADNLLPSGAIRAQVVDYFGKQALVALPTGELVTSHIQAKVGRIITGDWVALLTADRPIPEIAACLPRESILHEGPKNRLVAANVERLWVVIAPSPAPNWLSVDRCLIAAHLAGIDGGLITNKSDLSPTDLSWEERLSLYEGLGYPVIATQTLPKPALNALPAALTGHTSLFFGQSGVGKSSLINALIPDAGARTQALSKFALGRHTTVTTRLYNFPAGGTLLDSPGVRQFFLPPVAARDLLAAFPEFRSLQGQCRFRDCRHTAEPDCAVKAAMAENRVESRRWPHYEQMIEELKTYPKYS